MLKLKPNASFKGKVAIPIPGNGTVDIDVQFKYFCRDGYTAWLEEVKSTKKPYDEAVMDLVMGWSGVESEAGEPLEFNRANVAAVVDMFPGAGPAIVESHGLQLYGIK